MKKAVDALADAGEAKFWRVRSDNYLHELMLLQKERIEELTKAADRLTRENQILQEQVVRLAQQPWPQQPTYPTAPPVPTWQPTTGATPDWSKIQWSTQ